MLHRDFAFMLSVVKLLLKGEAGVCALNSHGIYIVDRGKPWKNHGIVFVHFCGNSALWTVNHRVLWQTEDLDEMLHK